MFDKINKRTIILILMIVIFAIIILINFIKTNNQDNDYTTQLNYEKYLDNGIQLSKLIEEKKYLDNIEITSIVNNNNIEYTLKNNSNDSVYISNEVEIIVGEDGILLSDTIEGKIELEPLEEKVITIDYTINQLSKKLGYRIDMEKISIIKPIYLKYDDNKLSGIAKGVYNGL